MDSLDRATLKIAVASPGKWEAVSPRSHLVLGGGQFRSSPAGTTPARCWMTPLSSAGGRTIQASLAKGIRKRVDVPGPKWGMRLNRYRSERTVAQWRSVRANFIRAPFSTMAQLNAGAGI